MPGHDGRRAFLAHTAGALVAAVAPQARGAEKLEPVRVAVIGTGARGSDLIRSLTTIAGCQLQAIADDYPPHLTKAAGYAGPGVKTYADYRPMLDEVRPQAVVVAVPLALHAAVCHDALEAGAHVFCEKTMCYSMDEARRLAARVKELGRVFQVGLQRRANPIYQQAAAMVRAGVLGPVSTIKAQWHRNNNWRRPVPVAKGDPNWERLERRLNWRLYRESSGGLMAELGSHQLDVCNWVLGTTPRRVLAAGGIDYWRDGREVADNLFCIYEYELPSHTTAAGGEPSPPYTVRVTYSSLCNNAYEGASELIEGTRGTLFLSTGKGLYYRESTAGGVRWASGSPQGGDGDDPNAALITAGKTLKMSNSPWAHRGEPIEIDFLLGDDTRDELVSFLDHVRRDDPSTICDVDEGLRDTATVLMANESLARGTWVDYPG